MRATVQWQGKLRFEASADSGHAISLDAPTAVGGEEAGSRPKELLLEGLAGCTAMDVIAILAKMKISPARFRVEVEADMTDEHPRVFTAFRLRYVVSDEVPKEKLDRAIELSQERYCGVTAMFRHFAAISHSVVYE